ncbi:hypothetical protein H2200_002581 [Cladophialophora chaetospira]|uniref:AAA+ ATPase domain-containing protein n=1 Tax=Cladophialophora chaetospira TaxID=386627 RepID=A0AA38XJ50_9EURO|nr:hypothetical protein H2200_002581 [Cladophialophora chaetospira]
MNEDKVAQSFEAMNLNQPQTPPPSAAGQIDEETLKHLQQFDSDEADGQSGVSELAAAPLFSSKVKRAFQSISAPAKPVIPAYGLLGLRRAAFNGPEIISTDFPPHDNLVYANLQHPWSAFICGQQGAGKSHTMSCLLENALLNDNDMGPNAAPAAGVVFHYDKFTSPDAIQVCEAAYLCSKGIKVQVLVSPSNLENMKRRYENLPGWPAGAPRPEVVPLLLKGDQLNVSKLKLLMGMDEDNKSPPLYMAVVNKVLKKLAVRPGANAVVDYHEMKQQITHEGLTESQMSFLNMRFGLIEWFLQRTAEATVRAQARKIEFQPGTILIVDLSCPFVTETDACLLFSIFLQIFLGQRGQRPLIVALDEAHKFLTEAPPAKAFTDDLITIVREQRHQGSRVVIATQEPIISTQLLNLCNVAVVHQFQSPEWYQVLKQHLAALAPHKNGAQDANDVFKTIVRLKMGEALVFCPKACFDVDAGEDKPKFKQLEDGYVKIKIRKRITADGGKSIVASEAGN